MVAPIAFARYAVSELAKQICAAYSLIGHGAPLALWWCRADVGASARHVFIRPAAV